uniref:F-box domain-containing protein n=1 Tax=Nyssomyia neivai TaxID=330878 RepID=A0A1L8D7D7_9DIPT
MAINPDEGIPSTTIFDLPVEDVLVTYIGKYLCWQDLLNFAKCSRECREIASMLFAKIEKISWSAKIDLQRTPQHQQLEILSDLMNYLSNYAKNLKTIEIDWDTRSCPADISFAELKEITLKGLQLISMNCKNLENLIIPYVDVDDDFLVKFKENNNQLRNLDISTSNRISESILEEFFRNQPHLIKIYLDLLDIHPTTLLAIADICHDIKSLWIPKKAWINIMSQATEMPDEERRYEIQYF